MRRAVVPFLLAATATAALPATAGAQAPPRVRLAAAADCARNVNCIPGFKRVYGMDPTAQLVRLKVADAGTRRSTTGPPRSLSRSRPTRSCRARTSSRCPTTAT